MLRTLVVLTLFASPVLAQDAPHVGKWKVTFPAGGKMENGAFTPIIGTGLLTVERVNDSLIGTLVVDPIPNVPPRPDIRMAATAGGGAEAVFTYSNKGAVTVNGEERPITSVSTWKMEVKGDSLVGTVDRKMQGGGLAMPMPGAQPMSGVRIS